MAINYPYGSYLLVKPGEGNTAENYKLALYYPDVVCSGVGNVTYVSILYRCEFLYEEFFYICLDKL